MAEQILKLSPDRDLQCFFHQPSAIAALSGASPNGFTLSGTWRQQFDWAVVEWNRDNVYEHPAIRYLPDPDLSGLTLSYVEQRYGCVPFESDIYPSVEWPYLRIWASGQNGEDVYFINLVDHAQALDSSYVNATATMTLTGDPSQGRVGLAFIGTFASSDDPSKAILEQHYYYDVQISDTLPSIAAGIASVINAFSTDVVAIGSGPSVICTYRGQGNLRDVTGANGNRVGVYGFVQNGSTLTWQEPAHSFAGGAFPSQYRVTLEFGTLQGRKSTPDGVLGPVPTNSVRKMRWTWAADLQSESYSRSEFEVLVSQWDVTGTGREYLVAGPGSRRIEDDDSAVVYSAPAGASEWSLPAPGNYSGSRIRLAQSVGASCTIQYSEAAQHELYLGTRMLPSGAVINVAVDGGAPSSFDLALPGEDVLVRLPLGTLPAGSHSVVLSHVGGPPGSDPNGTFDFFFDFLEIAYPSVDLPEFLPKQQLSLATDWDTLHAIALPAERTAWMIWKLGFHGRVNHYAGAIGFYELFRPGQQYAFVQATVSVTGGAPNGYTEIDVGTGPSLVTIQHLNLPDDTTESIAQALAFLINQGSVAIWASVQGSTLTITARQMGVEGNGLAIVTPANKGNVTVGLSSNTLGGGIDGEDVGFDVNDPNSSAVSSLTQYWRTDLAAMPRLNRACRDWSKAFFTALSQYKLDCVAAFSTELAHVDPRPSAGMAQRYSDGTPVWLNTPAIQTNFSSATLAFWTEVYFEMAGLQQAAGLVPYLQSGEVQWWYFDKSNWTNTGGQFVNQGDAGIGMPFYDRYTQQQFENAFGRSLPMLTSGSDPALFPAECSFLSGLIGQHTRNIRSAIQSAFANARYEVLYPVDTNGTALNRIVNYAASDWVPANLNCLKTESFSYTYSRDLDSSWASIRTSAERGFPGSQRSHLVGIGDAKTAWMKEVILAQSQGLESVVLFALDQFCLIGYQMPPFRTLRRSVKAA
jgi:hypothetical protein